MDAQRTGLRICVLALLLSIASCSQVKSDPPANTVADARTKVLYDGNVTFSLPDGLEPVALSVVRSGVEPNEGDQTHAFANSGNTLQVIVNLSNVPAKPEDLDEVQHFVEGLHKSYSQWEISEITEINGRRWFHFEWQKPPPVDLVEPPPLDDGPRLRCRRIKGLSTIRSTRLQPAANFSNFPFVRYRRNTRKTKKASRRL
jgi:hypothetical protein